MNRSASSRIHTRSPRPSPPAASPIPPYRAASVLFVILIAGCSSPPPVPVFTAAPPAKPYTASEALKKFDADPGATYRLGEGDVLAFNVWDRIDLSGTHVVGPDGMVTLAVSGPIRVAGLTREEAAKAAKEALSKFYSGISVTVRVDQYVSNRVIVLGRVRSPGVQRFDTVPTVLEVISRAGGLADDAATFHNLTHCAVIRGRDRMAMLDLRSLMEAGDLSMNLRLQANDIVLVPDWTDQPIYALGQVAKPGPMRWFRGMTVLDALALAGGMTRDANNVIHLIRPSRNDRTAISQNDLLDPTSGANVAVERGDILYVTTNLLADIGYLFEKLNPFGWVFVAQSVRR